MYYSVWIVFTMMLLYKTAGAIAPGNIDTNECQRLPTEEKKAIPLGSIQKAMDRLAEEWFTGSDPVRPLVVNDDLNHFIYGNCFVLLPPRDGTPCWEAAPVKKGIRETCDSEQNHHPTCRTEIRGYAEAWRQKHRSSDFLHYLRTCAMPGIIHPVVGFAYRDMWDAYTTAIKEVVSPPQETGLFSSYSSSDQVTRPRPTATDARNWISFLAHSRSFDAGGRLLAFLNECIETYHECRSFEVRRARAILWAAFSHTDMARQDWAEII